MQDEELKPSTDQVTGYNPNAEGAEPQEEETKDENGNVVNKEGKVESTPENPDASTEHTVENPNKGNLTTTENIHKENTDEA